MNLQDGEIQNLISRAEDIIAQERAAARTETESAPAPTDEETTDTKVQNAFSDIARSGSESDANFKIREASVCLPLPKLRYSSSSAKPGDKRIMMNPLQFRSISITSKTLKTNRLTFIIWSTTPTVK